MAREGTSGRSLTDRKIILAVVIGCVSGLFISLVSISPARSSNLSSKDAGPLQLKLSDLEQKRQAYETLEEEASSRVRVLKQRRTELSQLQEELSGERDSMLKELESRGEATMSKVGPQGTVKGPRMGTPVAVDPMVNTKLSETLLKVARVKEVLVIFADDSRRSQLELCLKSVKQLGISHYLVVALGDSIEAVCASHGAPVYVHAAGKDVRNPHAFARRKFALLRDFIVLGYRVLAADPDVIFLKNPFAALSRDADIEGMSANGTDARAYGEGAWIDDPAMGWARYAVTSRIFFLDPGLFHLQCTDATLDLVDRLVTRLVPSYNGTAEMVFNEEIFLPSHTGYDGLHISRRVLDYNSFVHPRFILKGPGKQFLKASKPVLVRVNTERDKLDFMSAVLEFGEKGRADVFSRFKWD